MVFLPIAGRRGPVNNPDILVGCSISFLFTTLVQFLTPLTLKMKRSSTKLISIGMVRQDKRIVFIFDILN